MLMERTFIFWTTPEPPFPLLPFAATIPASKVP
jgi:hypothetical protein